MVIKTKSFPAAAASFGKSVSKASAGATLRRAGIKSGGDASTSRGPNQHNTANKKRKPRLVIHVDEESADEVIDLGPPPRRRRPGAPPSLPRRFSYTPNPRLYTAPRPARRTKSPCRRPARRSGGAAHSARRGTLVRPPNPRLYPRPPPRRAPPPAVPPVPPPPPPPPHAPLDTASRAALRLRAMEGETAPAELLAEFLSATLQRQYGAALECCRRILQFEPHNATARAFYPLLCHRLSAERLQRHAQEAESSSGAGCAGSTGAAGPDPGDSDDSESERSVSDSTSTQGTSRSNRDSEDSSSASLVSLNTPASTSYSGGGRWSNNSSPDENGNEPDLMPADENDNGSSESATDISVQEDNALKQLRARFACSIK